MEARGATRARRARRPACRPGCWALIPLALIAVAVAAFALLDGPGLGDRNGPPVEELAVERTVLQPGQIELTVRNDGPDDGDDRAGDRERRLRRLHGHRPASSGHLDTREGHDPLPVGRGRAPTR